MAVRSIANRVALWSSALVVIVFGCATVLNYRVAYVQEQEELFRKRDTYLAYMAESLVEPLWAMNDTIARAIGDAWMADEDAVFVRIAVSHAEEPVFEAGERTRSRVLKGAAEIVQDGEVLGTVEIGLSTESLNRALKQFLWYSAAAAAALAATLAAGIIGFLRVALGRPMADLGRWVEDVAAGNYAPPYASFEGSEIETVAQKFAAMASRVEEREKAITDSERRFREMADMLPQVIFETDLETNLTYTNQRGYELFGYAPEELPKPFSVMQVIAPGERERAAQNMGRRLRGEAVDGNEYELLKRDGATFPALLFTTPFTVQGKLHGLRGVMIDITERKKLERTLQFMQHAVEHFADAVVILRKDASFSYVNEAACRKLGYSREELLGMSVPDVDPNFPHEAWGRHWDEIAESGGLNLETVHQTKSGERFPVEVAVNQVVFGEETFQCAIARDISDRKAMEARILQSQKLEALGTLSGGISHDFNNLIQAISGYCELLLLRDDNPAETTKMIGSIREASNSAARLVQEILAFSRMQEVEKRPLNLNDEVRKAVELLRRTIPKMIGIETLFESKLWPIMADPVQLEQVLMNIALNARDAMGESGTLTVETVNQPARERPAGVLVSEGTGDCVVLRISDTGAGMDPETRRRIFEPFFTTKEVGKGTGLGLATTYGIIKAHGGDIQCTSEPGRGTEFSVYLPATHPSNEARERDDSTDPDWSPGAAGGTERILVVDDEPLVRAIAVEALARSGYTVEEADSGEAAVRLYREALETRNPFQLVLLDLGMPGMGGRRCLEELLRIDASTKVLVVSGYSQAAQAKGILGAGARGILQKPYRLAELTRTARAILDHDT